MFSKQIIPHDRKDFQRTGTKHSGFTVKPLCFFSEIGSCSPQPGFALLNLLPKSRTSCGKKQDLRRFQEFALGHPDKKPASPNGDTGFLSMSYEIDIFAVFAYDFELLHNRSFLVKSFAYAHGEIIYSVNCEI